MSTPIVEPPRDVADVLKNLTPRPRAGAAPAPTPTDPTAGPNPWAEARANRQEALGEYDWDPLWRPVQHALNVLTAGGAGILNMVDKGIGLVKPLEENENLAGKIIGALPPVSVAKGFWSAFTNNTDSENYVMGHDVIENATDAFGSRFDPKYVDTEDNANPWLKGIGGFALDVALDPITYIPGGVIASGVRGGVRAGRLASGLGKVPAAARGVVKGTEVGDLKFGRFSGAVKPIGFEQWKANRALNKIDRIASKSGITSNNAVWTTPANLAKNEATFEQAAKKLNSDSAEVLAKIGDDPKLLASAQKTYRTDWTAETVEALGNKIGPLAKDLDDFLTARTAGQQVRVTTRRVTQSKEASGATAYKYGSAAERSTRIVKEQQKILAEQNLKQAFYASMKGETALADETADPFMSKVREAVGESFTADSGATRAQQGMKQIDSIYEVEEGTTEGMLQKEIEARLLSGKDFSLAGLGENTYQYTEMLQALIYGKNIGLTAADANLFGEVVTEAVLLAHDLAPAARLAAAGAPVTAPAKALVQEPSVTPKSAADDVTESPFSVDVAPESIIDTPPPPTGRAEGTVELLWDQATVNVYSDTATRLAKTSKSLEKEIDEVYETVFDTQAFIRRDKGGYRPAFVAGAVAPKTGALAEALDVGRFDSLIDTRHINSVGKGPLAAYDKALLGPFLEKIGVRYHPIGEVVDGVPRNKAMHAPGSPSFGAIAEDADFEQGIDEIVEQLGGSKRVAILVFEGTSTYNKKQVLVANALAKKGIHARLIVQTGVPQGRETLDMIAEPLLRQSEVVKEELANIVTLGTKVTEDRASITARTILRASGERQAQAAYKLLTQGEKEDWVANVNSMVAANNKAYTSVAEKIVARSNIITNLLSSNQNETSDLVVKLLALGGASTSKGNVETFFKSIFGDRKPVAESFSVEATPTGEIQYIVNEPEIVVRAIQALAELKTEIPGYTDRARAILAEIAVEPDALNAANRTQGTVSEEMFSELGWVARTYAPAFRENPGANINIFGEVIEEGDASVAEEMGRVIETIARQFLVDAEVPPLIASEEVAKIFVLLSDTAPTSNNLGLNVPAQRGTLSAKYGNVQTPPLQQRWIENMPINKSKEAEALRKELGEPWKSTELNDIYDHVAGFATTPIGSYDAWAQAVGRVAAHPTSPYRFKARKLLGDTPATTSTKATTGGVDFTAPAIKGLRGENAFLSNMHETKVTIGGVTYRNSEAAFQAAKSTDPEVQATFANMSGKEAKAAGKKVKLRPDWEERKVSIMETILTAKFAENPALAKKLIATKGSEIVESNAWHDAFWGVSEDTGKGQNMLGKTLMKIRDSLAPDDATPRTGALAPAAAGAGRAAYEKYVKAFDLKVDASKNYGVDLFGRVFRDLSPQQPGSTRAMYAAYKDPKEKNFGDKLWKMSLRHETRKDGFVHVDIQSFTKELNKQYGQTRTQELLPFIREIEATRLKKQAAETLARTKENVKEAQAADAPFAFPFADEIAASKTDDPLYASLSPLERLPDELRRVVAEGILRPAITTVRGSIQRVNKPAVLDWFRSMTQKKHVQYRVVPTVTKFDEEATAAIAARFHNPKIHQKILELVKGGQVINTAKSATREALGPGPELSEKGATSGFMKKWFGEDTGGAKVVKKADSEYVGVRSIRETMDIVRAEDMGEAFWTGLGGDFMVKWNPREDPDLDAFVQGVAHLLNLDPLSDRSMLQKAVMAAAAKSDGDGLDFLYSNFVEELAAGVKNATTEGIERVPGQAETLDIVLNGRKVDGFTREIIVNAGRPPVGVKSNQELIDAVFDPNIYHPVGEEAVLGVMATLEEVSAATATIIPNQIRKKDVPGLFDRAKQEMIQATRTWNDYMVPNGEAIVARAAQLGDNGIVANISRATETSTNRIAKIRDVSARSLVQNSAVEAVKQSIKRMGDQGKRIFDQYAEMVAFQEIRIALAPKNGTKFIPNTPEHWKAQQIARAEYQALLHRSGVYQTTSIHGKDNVFKVDLDKQHNWAYLDFMDTYRAVVAGSLELDVLFREAMDLRSVGGMRFPQTLLPELGVYAMQLAKTGVKPQERVVLLYDYAQTVLGRTKELQGWAKELDPFEGESFANGFVSRLVVSLSDDTVAAKLYETHLNNGAAALKVAETNSRQIIESVATKLLAVGQSTLRNYGAKSTAINQSIDDLRAELTRLGFAKASPEALISAHALQKLHVDNFDTLDMNGARNAYRFARATHVGANGEDPLSAAQVAARQEYLGKNWKRAMPERMRLEKIRQAGNTERARLASESLPTARDMSVNDAIAMGEKALEINDLEGLLIAYEKAINIGEHIQRTNSTLQATFRGGREAFDAREAAAARAAALRETWDDAVKQTPEAERVALTGDPDGFWSNLRAMFSGRSGQQDVKATAAAIENTYDGWANAGEKAIESAIKMVQKRMGDKTGQQAEAWHTQLVLATFGTKRYNFIAQEADPELAKLAEEIQKVWFMILDTRNDGLIARGGLDTNHYNKSLINSPMGGVGGKNPPESQLPRGFMGWEIQEMIPEYLEALMDASKGGRSALQVFKGLNYALNDAAKIPEMAAQFSAQFGHRSFGYLTVKDALAAGFKQIKTGPEAGTLARWLDEGQAYPPEFIRQMGNLQKFLDFETRFKKGGMRKVIGATDKITSVMKSSLTIWRPGHHVVSAGGDALMNLLDGVVSPYRYHQSMRIMRSAGQFHKGTFFGRDKGAEFGKFMGEYDMAATGGKGIDVQINGVNRTVADADLYRMFSDSGILINNNTAEDLLAIGDEISLSGGKLSQFFRPIVKANRALGEFSARRDNVLRIAHAVDIMQRRGFRSLDEMKEVLTREIMEWHPTLQTLSGFERKYMRRLFYFYTWMRNAANKVFETVLENPRYLTVVPKANIGISVGMGGDPQSMGQPMPNDPRLPEFASRNILGPAWYDDDGNVVGVTVNSPQLDIFQDLLGKISVDPNASLSRNFVENAKLVYRENTIGFLSPIPKFAIESMTGTEYQEYGQVGIKDWGEHLIDQTGLGIISRATGTALINNQGVLQPRSDLEDIPAEQGQKQARTLSNAITGAKWTEWSQWYKVAGRERRERNRVYLEELMKNLNG